MTLPHILSSSILYTLLVFSAGFLCGCIRVPFLQPLLGDRRAQLLEMPVMAGAMWKSAKIIVSRLRSSAEISYTSNNKSKLESWTDRARYYAIGLFALVQMVALEAGLYLWMHWSEGKTIGD